MRWAILHALSQYPSCLAPQECLRDALPQQRPFVKLRSIVHQGDASQSPLKRAASSNVMAFDWGLLSLRTPKRSG